MPMTKCAKLRWLALVLFAAACGGGDDGGGGSGTTQKCKTYGPQNEYCICSKDGFSDANVAACPQKTDQASGVCCFAGLNTTTDTQFCACEPFDPSTSSCTEVISGFAPTCPLCTEVVECTSSF